MGFGGQFDYNNSINPGRSIYGQMRKKSQETDQRLEAQKKSDLDRYNRILNPQPPQNQVSFPIPPSQPTTPTQPIPQQTQSLNTPPLTKSNSQPISVSEYMTSTNVKTPKQETSKVNDSLNQKLSSDDPGVFSNAMEELGILDEGKLVPDTPAFNMVQKAEARYGIGVDDKGGKMYECPLTKTPCGKKTFWSRLKEFFQTLLGIKSKEEAIQSVMQLNTKDPISKQFTSKQPQVTSQSPAVSSIWKRPGQMSGFKGEL